MWRWSCISRTTNAAAAASTARPTLSLSASASVAPWCWMRSSASPSLPLTHAAAHSTIAAAAKRRLSPTTATRQFALGHKRTRLDPPAATATTAAASLHSAAPTATAAAAAANAQLPTATAVVSWTLPPSDINMSTAPISQADPVLQLTELERRIFERVLAACAMFKLDTQIRVAGGWVRDKLLGLESEDIDFALDNMSGEEFANKLSEYVSSVGEKTSSVGVIKVNPDQSKHLATATMKLLDVCIDINNFREEIYEANSRIPTISLSTAREDALRRDFCVNSLFYNIHTNKIEDFVGGLDDLRKGMLRTPRDPFKTFSDDPLRILRAARFAGRFGFQVDEAISAAAQSPAIQQDLSSKVSRERMGIEVGKMLQTYRASFISFQLLCQQWGLRRIVFEVAPQFEPAPVAEIGLVPLQSIEPKGADAEDKALTARCLEGMRLVHEEVLRGSYAFSPDEASTLLLAAFLIPYHGYRVEVKKGRYASLVWYVVRESLRLTQREATLASDLLAQAHQLIRASYLHEYAQSAAACDASASAAASDSSAPVLSATDRLQLVTGGVLRQTGSYSVVAMRLGEILLQTLPEGQQIRLTNECAFDLSLGLPDDFKPPSTPALDRFGAYCEWIANKSKLLQLPVWEMKPLASGTEVCAALGISAKGPHVGQVIAKMVDWQLLNMDAMLPLYASAPASAAAQTEAAAASSSSTAAAAPAASPAAAAAAAAELAAPVKAACFEWLQQFKSSFIVETKGRGGK